MCGHDIFCGKFSQLSFMKTGVSILFRQTMSRFDGGDRQLDGEISDQEMRLRPAKRTPRLDASRIRNR